MPWKKNEDGTIALDAEGNPIYVHKDGAETGLNGDAIFIKQAELVEEKKRIKAEAGGLKAQLEALGDYAKDPEAVKNAFEVLADVEAGKLIAAGKQDEAIKRVLSETNAKHQQEVNKIAEEAAKMARTLKRAMVDNAINSSTFLKKNTEMPLSVAKKMFSDYFETVDTDDGKSLVCKVDGEPILSLKPERSGRYADPDEAIQRLFEQLPEKEYFLPRMPGGPSGPGVSTGRKGDIIVDHTKLTPAEYNALKTKATAEGVKVIDSKTNTPIF